MKQGSVTVEYFGQVVYPCTILRSFGPFLRVVMPVKGEPDILRWVPKWRVIEDD